MYDQAENLRKKVSMKNPKKLVCIGASTGGPGALGRILPKLPQNMDSPILIVQHMPPKFTKALADRLNIWSKITVKEAEHGEPIRAGTAYISPGDCHMNVKQTTNGVTVSLRRSVPRNGHRPSLNELFESMAELTGYEKTAVILSGMGTDGVDGLRVLKARGNTYAIAESKASAVVFGMPRAAIASGLVDEVLHVDRIGECLIEKLNLVEGS
jgi:two-component system chemotaxis response regulator CheB